MQEIIDANQVGAVFVANISRLARQVHDFELFGMRAALCHDIYSAHQSVEHDDVNVLAPGAQVVGPAVAHELVEAFLEASSSGRENHHRRVDKIKAMEERRRTGLELVSRRRINPVLKPGEKLIQKFDPEVNLLVSDF